MKSIPLTMVATACLSILAATPQFVPDAQLRDVAMVQNSDTRVVTISYEIDAPAVVTLDLQTNGVSLSQTVLDTVVGDTNCRVESGRHSFDWRPYETLSAMKQMEGVEAVVTAWAVDCPPDWMVVDLRETGADRLRYYASSNAIPGGIGALTYKTDKMILRKCHARNVEWMMGSPVGEVGRTTDASATTKYEYRHRVTLTNDYYLAIYETTQAQCLNAYGDRKSAYTGDDADAHPVDSVSCKDLRGGVQSKGARWPDQGHGVTDSSVIGKFRARTGVEFDLPTSAQWEFACRAGSTHALYNGKDLTSETGVNDTLEPIAWYVENSGSAAHAVGGKQPNAWGFHDMLGNVWEYVLDAAWADATVYTEHAPAIEPVGPTLAEAANYSSANQSCYNRHFRGGSCKSKAARCRAAYTSYADIWWWQDSYAGERGFRLAAPALAIAE